MVAVSVAASEYFVGEGGRHLFSSHQSKLIAHLSDEHVATVDRELPASERVIDEWRRTRAVNEIDDDGMVAQAFQFERHFIRVAPDRCCVHDDIVTFSVEVRERNVRQTE